MYSRRIHVHTNFSLYFILSSFRVDIDLNSMQADWPIRTRSWSLSPLFVSRDSFSPLTWARLESIAYSSGCLYTSPWKSFYGLSAFGLLLVLGLYKEDYLHMCKCVSFSLHSVCCQLEGWHPINRTSLVDVGTPVDRPKSVSYRCVIELFVGVLCRYFAFSVGVRVFVTGVTQISSFFSRNSTNNLLLACTLLLCKIDYFVNMQT